MSGLRRCEIGLTGAHLKAFEFRRGIIRITEIRGDEFVSTDAVAADALIELAVESWRLSRQFMRSLDLKEASTAQRQSGQIRYFQKRLDDILAVQGLRIINLEGQPYDAGSAVSGLNSGDFAPEDQLVVEQMIEPTIMDESGVRRLGTAMLRKR
jgi:hypothetical protein